MFLRALLLLVLAMASSWPTWSLPGWDGTEGRRVQIAREMEANGDLLVPTLGREPTWAKPPLHYWLLVAASWFGSGVHASRLPGVLAAWVAALLAGELLRRRFGARAGWLGALGILTSPLVLFEWPTAEIDPVFATLTAGSLWCLASGVASERRAMILVSGVIGGLAVLTKGPPYFVFAAGAWLVWWRHRGGRGFLLHLVPLLLVVLAYYVPLCALRVSVDELLAVAGEESAGRIAFFTWHHVKTIPGFWLQAIAVQLPFAAWCFWEWRGARDARMDANDLVLRMCSGAAVVAVAVLTVFPGRPTRYLLPNVLLFTFAVTPAVAHFATFAGPVPRFARVAMRTTGILGAVALCVVPFVPEARVGALGLAGVAAISPLFSTSGRWVVTWCLLLPVVASWTAGLDRAMGWEHGPRSRSGAAALFTRELERGGARGSDVQTFGHFDSPLLLAIGQLPRGDEARRHPWQARWVLHEVDTIPAVVVPAHYAMRCRIDTPFKSFALSERVGAPR